MVCTVTPIDGQGPIMLVDPLPQRVIRSGGDPVDICELRLVGASFQAVAKESEVPQGENVKKDVTVLPNDKCDVLHLNDIILLEVDPEYILRIELRIGGLFIAEGVLNRTAGTVNFFSTKFDYPICAVRDHTFEIWTWHTNKETKPQYAIAGCMVDGEEGRAKLRAVKLNLVFTYAGSDDMNIMTIKDNMAGLRCHKTVFDDGPRPIVRCLLANKPENLGRTYTKEELEAWLNANYVFTPRLPITLPMIEQ